MRIKSADLCPSFAEKLSDEQKKRLLWQDESEDVFDADSFMNAKEQAEVEIDKIFSLTSLVDEISSSDEELKEKNETKEEDTNQKSKKEISSN